MRSTKDCLCGCDMQLLEEGTHVGAKGLVMLIDAAPVLRFAALFGTAGSGENRLDDFLAQDLERRDHAQALGKRVIAAGALPLAMRFFPRSFFRS